MNVWNNPWFLGFSLGYTANTLVRIITVRYSAWRFNRDFAAAEARMAKCSHIHMMKIDIGLGTEHMADKCLDCWALCLDISPGPNGEKQGKYWTPNSAKPPSSKDKTLKGAS